MSIKNVFISCLIVIIGISSITTKNENAKKFLSKFGIVNPVFNPIFFISEAPKMKSFASDNTKLINIKCLYSKNYNMYSLQALQKKNEDYKIAVPGEDATIKFNFCQNTLVDNTSTVIKVEGNETVRLAGSIEGEGEDKNVWTEMGEEGNPTGISISLVSGDQCNGDEKHQTQLEITCDSEVDDENFLETIKYENINNTCLHKITMRSLYGCSLRSSYLFIKLLNDYKLVFCILFVIVGIIFCFFGKRYMKYLIMIICGFIGCYAITAAILNFFPNFITTELWLLVCLLVCFILGCILGWFLKDEIKFSVLITGAFLGYSCATFVYQIVQNYVEFDPQILYYACVGVCIVVGALLGWFLTDPILIIGTSVFGGYLAMRGVSLVAGNYLDEGYIIDLIKNKEWEQLKEIRDGWTYAYLGSWVILAIAGIFIQCKNNKKTKSNKV